jgi:hypothetical protein
MLVFYELALFSMRMMATRLGTKRIDWAFFIGRRSLVFYQLAHLALQLVSLAALVVAPLWFGLKALEKGNIGTALALGAVPVLSVGSWLFNIPGRRRVRRENTAMTAAMAAVYDHLGGPTISPRRLRELVDDAAKVGAVFDGAVFALVDRMTAADPTALVRPR